MKTTLNWVCYLVIIFCLILPGCKKKTTDVTPAKGGEKEIKSFDFKILNPAVSGVIDAGGKTVKAEVPIGTDLTKLAPVITLSDKASVSPASGVSQDFSKPVTYTVTAGDGTSQSYVVTITFVNNGTVFFGSRDKKVYALDALNGVKKWEFVTGGEVLSSPVAANGLVFIGCDDKKLYALDQATGAKKWEFLTGEWMRFNSPAVADGIVYIATDKVYALDATTGAKKWEFLGDDTYDFESSPTIVNGVVYVSLRGTAFSKQGVGTFALDAKTGAKIWTEPTRVWVTESSPAVVNDVVYAGSELNGLEAFDAKTGTRKWTYKTGDFINISSPTVSNGMVYIGSWDKKLHAVDAATGAKKWEFLSEGAVDSSPIVSGGVVYIGSYDARLYALDAATGAKKWDFLTTKFSEIESSPTVANGLVYIGSNDKKLYAVDAATGAKKWEFLTDGGVRSSVCVVAKDGKVYFAGISGMVQ